MLRDFFKRHRKIDRGAQTDITGDFKIEKHEEDIESCKTMGSSTNTDNFEKTKVVEMNFYDNQLKPSPIPIVTSLNHFKSFHQATVLPADDPYFFPAPDESALYSDEFCSLTRKVLSVLHFPSPEGPATKKVTVAHIRNVYFQEQNGCMIDYFSTASYGRYGRIIWASDNKRACFCCCSSYQIGTNVVVDIGLPTFVGFTVEEFDPFLCALKSIAKSTVNYYNELPS